MVNDACESSLSKLRECLHQGLEEGGVVGVGVLDFSSTSSSLNLGSCGGYIGLGRDGAASP